MACHRLGPRIWLSTITFGFGLVTLCTAFIENYHGLVVCRLLLGVCESGVQPGIVYAYSQFYRRHEMASRLGIKAAGASIAGAFGGLLGSGLGRIPQHGILKSWRWIFLIEGLLTLVLAVVVFALMPGDVETSKFLNNDEREVASRRIAQENMTTGEERMDLATFKKALWNPNTQMTGLALIMSLLSLTSLSLFMVSCFIARVIKDPLSNRKHSLRQPTLLKSGMGYSPTNAQLFSVPPYVAAAIACVIGSFLADRLHTRGYILLTFTPLTITGFVILATVKQAGVRYFALFIATTGAFTCSPILLAWVSGNSAGPAVRAIVTAYAVGIANVGSIIATWTYLPGEAPYYRMGHWINCGAACILFLAVGCNMVYLKMENRMRMAGKRDHRLAGATEGEIGRLGHHHPEFRYTP